MNGVEFLLCETPEAIKGFWERAKRIPEASGVRKRMQAAGSRPWAMVRVCTHCHLVLGLRDGTTGQEIPLSELTSCRVDFKHAANMITGGVCPDCFEEETGTPWPGERT